MKRFLILLPLLLGLARAVFAESFVVTDIRIEGLQRISPGSVFNEIPIKVNDRIDQAAIAQTSRALFKSGNFDDVQIGRDGDVLVITLVERPSISEINIDGNKAIKTEDLLEGLKGSGLAVGQVFQRATLEQMRVELQRQYVSQGRYDATIETEVAEQARNRVAVNIDINEGSVARIKHINIVGNSVFGDRDLVDLFELKTTGWFSWISGNDKYSREKLNGGLENLSSYYLDRGYIRFNIDSTQVAITPDRSAVYITVNVTEGEKYKVTTVDLSGDIVIPESEMRGFLLLRDGQDFSQVQVTNTEEMITQRLGVEGYTFAKVNGIPEIDDENKTVALKFFVDPGKRTYVRRIEFRGNTKSVDEVLRREMRQMESAPASSAQIEQSRVRVERLGFFKEVKTENVPVPGTDDMIDVQYTVEEQSSGSIGASVGYAQDAGLILGANLQQNNFLGTGKQVGIGLNSSKYQDLYSFNYVNPYYTADGVSRGFSVFYRSTDLEEINVASYTTDTIGGTMSFGYPISETQRLGLSLGVNRTDISAGIGAVQEISGSPRPIEDTVGYVNRDDLNDFGLFRPGEHQGAGAGKLLQDRHPDRFPGHLRRQLRQFPGDRQLVAVRAEPRATGDPRLLAEPLAAGGDPRQRSRVLQAHLQRPGLHPAVAPVHLAPAQRSRLRRRLGRHRRAAVLRELLRGRLPLGARLQGQHAGAAEHAGGALPDPERAGVRRAGQHRRPRGQVRLHHLPGADLRRQGQFPRLHQRRRREDHSQPGLQWQQREPPVRRRRPRRGQRRGPVSAAVHQGPALGAHRRVPRFR
ncbi:MAG: outer membrane protein assembly factor BamA [Gammaproteobacteria bacterium]|nr:outer membrane protein assembly factor BamA [Gammaproteobacteria bacterium]